MAAAPSVESNEELTQRREGAKAQRRIRNMITPRIAYVVAIDANRLIGRDNTLPWRLPDDCLLYTSRCV